MTSTTSRYTARPREPLVTALFILGCIATSIAFVSRLDIGLYDETAYLQRGAWIDAHGLPTADMAPVYSLWYRCLQFIVSDPVHRYFVNYAVTMAALPILIFLLLRATNTALIPSLLTGSFVQVSSLNVLNWPRVSVFALILLLIGLLFQIRSTRRDAGWLGITVATAFVLYIRPEFGASLAVIVLLWAIDITKRARESGSISWSYPTVALVVITLLLIKFGNPYGHGRSMIAFGQHYALNVIEAGDRPVDPWTNWESLAQKDLGTTTSLSEAFRNAPDRVLWHVERNMSQLFPTWARLYMPAGARLNHLAWALLLVQVLLLLRLGWFHRRRSPPVWFRALPVILALVLPALLSAIVIHPRQHYLLFPAVLFLLVLVGLAYRPATERPGMLWRWSPAVVLLLLVVLHSGSPIAPKGRPTLATIEALRSLPISQPLVILEADGGYDAYLPAGTVRINAQGTDIASPDVLVQKGVNVIVASPRLMQDHRFAGDPTWQRFFAGDYREGFTVRPVEGTRTRLFVRHEVFGTQP